MRNPADYLDLNKLKEQPQNGSESVSRNLSHDDIDELWRRMSRIYGIAWATMFGSSDDDTWLRGLSDFTPQDLAIGLEACAKQKPDEDGNLFPPNLPKFRSMCKPKPYIYHNDVPSIPAPKISKEDALKHLTAIRESLK